MKNPSIILGLIVTISLCLSLVSELPGRPVWRGNTGFVTGNNQDVLKSTDYLIDIGPEGEDAGCEIVAFWTLEQAGIPKKCTGQFLKTLFRVKEWGISTYTLFFRIERASFLKY